MQRLFPLSFGEFLWAKGKEGMAQVISGGDLEMMAVFHDRIRRLQEQIVLDYREDFSKHLEAAPRGLPLRLNQAWDSIPSQLARENKKFVYGAVKNGARGRDFDLVNGSSTRLSH